MNTQIVCNPTDQTLIKSYLNGDENSLSVLIQRHKTKIFTSVYFIVRNRDLAEDIFQDTFVKIIDTFRSGKYQEEGKFLPWALRISYNLCIDHFRRNKKMPTITTEDGVDVFSFLKIYDENIEDKISRKETADIVRQLIDKLPNEQREIVVMRHYADLSFKEISDITGISINTALGRMRYALINLRKMIVEKQISL